MLEKVSSTKILFSFTIFMIIMFTIVMFLVNPMIDGKNGFDVIKLQLSFFKNDGVSIINNWGTEGINNFRIYIFTDYLYALSYVLFFVSLLSKLILDKKRFNYIWTT